MTTAPQRRTYVGDVRVEGQCWVENRQRIEQQAHDVLAGRHAADRAGQDIVEHQGRDRELGQESAQGLFDHAIHAAADKQRAALDVDRADGIAEQHHRQDEPGGGGPDGALDDAADVVGRAGQIAQHHRRGAPVRNEREHHAADDDHFDRPTQPVKNAVRSRRGGNFRHRMPCRF